MGRGAESGGGLVATRVGEKKDFVFVVKPGASHREVEEFLAARPKLAKWRIAGEDESGVHVARALPAPAGLLGLEMKRFGEGWLLSRGPSD